MCVCYPVMCVCSNVRVLSCDVCVERKRHPLAGLVVCVCVCVCVCLCASAGEKSARERAREGAKESKSERARESLLPQKKKNL